MVVVYTLAVIIVVTLIAVTSLLAYQHLGWFKFTYHDVFKLHQPDDEFTWSGLHTRSKCIHCGKDIVKDDYGRWH